MLQTCTVRLKTTIVASRQGYEALLQPTVFAKSCFQEALQPLHPTAFANCCFQELAIKARILRVFSIGLYTVATVTITSYTLMIKVVDSGMIQELLVAPVATTADSTVAVEECTRITIPTNVAVDAGTRITLPTNTMVAVAVDTRITLVLCTRIRDLALQVLGVADTMPKIAEDTASTLLTITIGLTRILTTSAAKTITSIDSS
jgi:hypothetical protein